MYLFNSIGKKRFEKFQEYKLKIGKKKSKPISAFKPILDELKTESFSNPKLITFQSLSKVHFRF